MTATVRIAATMAADVYVTSITTTRHFAAMNLSSNDDPIKIEILNSSGGYEDMKYLDGSGRPRTAILSYDNNIITLNGGDVRFSKPETYGLVELVEYT